MDKGKKYYMKNGIKCSWRDLRYSLKHLRFAVVDLVVGLSKLLWLKLRGKK